jgi:hypothetical protein
VEHQVLLAQRDPRVVQDLVVNLVLQDPPDLLAVLDLRVVQDLVVNLVLQDPPDLLAVLDLREHQEQGDHLEHRELLVLRDHPVKREVQVHQVVQDPVDKQGVQVLLVVQDLVVKLGVQDRAVLLVHLQVQQRT